MYFLFYILYILYRCEFIVIVIVIDSTSVIVSIMSLSVLFLVGH